MGFAGDEPIFNLMILQFNQALIFTLKLRIARMAKTFVQLNRVMFEWGGGQTPKGEKKQKPVTNN